MLDTLGVLIGLLIILAVLIVLFYLFWVFVVRAIIVTNLAQKDFLFTFRKEGHIKYLMEGDVLIEYIDRIQGHYVEESTGNVLEGDSGKPKQSLSERLFGAYWIGFPPRRVKAYNITYARPRRASDVKLAKDDPEHYLLDNKHDIVERDTMTDYHAWKQIYSIYMPKIEVKGFAFKAKGSKTKIQGQAQVDVWGTFTLITENARTPVLDFDGKWFPHIRDAISGAAADFLNKLTLDEIRQINMFSGQNNATQQNGALSDFEQAIINASYGPSGTIETTGLRILAFNTAGFEVEDKAEEVLRKRGIAQVEAETREIQGRAEGAFERERGVGIAAAYKEQVAAISADPVAASVLAARERSEALKHAKNVSTYVEGGAQTPVMISPTPQPRSSDPTPEPKPQDKEKK